MGGQHGHFIEHRAPSLIRLFPGGRDADNDITEGVARELGEVSLSQSEGEHVGWTIFLAVRLVQFVNARIVG